MVKSERISRRSSRQQKKHISSPQHQPTINMNHSHLLYETNICEYMCGAVVVYLQAFIPFIYVYALILQCSDSGKSQCIMWLIKSECSFQTFHCTAQLPSLWLALGWYWTIRQAKFNRLFFIFHSSNTYNIILQHFYVWVWAMTFIEKKIIS